MPNKPTGIDERPEQLRPAIVKAVGTTAAERYLAKLAGKSFLSFWSYPNPFRDQKQQGKGDGKELCDLLVICGHHVLIFSEKSISWPSGDIAVAWPRWARGAIKAAARQIAGAERWLRMFPDRVFLDSSCTNRLPVNVPEADEVVFHHIVVAQGAAEACQKHAQDQGGRLKIRPDIIAEKNWSNENPFCVGDINPNGAFVHIFDEVSIDIVMKELDTITDFTDYLDKKEKFIRSGSMLEACGEENLLAYYAIRANEDGDHDFAPFDDEQDEPGKPILINHQHYPSLSRDPRYIAKKYADQVSYLWDELIELFSGHALNGTSIVLDGSEFSLKNTELSVRFMALEPRFSRRVYGKMISEALKESRKHDRFCRTMLPTPESKSNETGFFLLTVKYLDWMEEKIGYEDYRRARSNLLKIYADGLLVRHPNLKRIIGITREPPDQGRGVSEDLIYVEQKSWSKDEILKVNEECRKAGVLSDNLTMRRFEGDEYPSVQAVHVFADMPRDPTPTRKMRRREKALKRKKVRARKNLKGSVS